MNRIRKSTLLTMALLGVVAGALAACGGDSHGGHDHKPGEAHVPRTPRSRAARARPGVPRRTTP
jgi:hypothetical protein